MKKDAVKGRAVYVLVFIVLLNMLYPITDGNNAAAQILYQILYAGLFLLGIFVTSDEPFPYNLFHYSCCDLVHRGDVLFA